MTKCERMGKGHTHIYQREEADCIHIMMGFKGMNQKHSLRDKDISKR